MDHAMMTTNKPLRISAVLFHLEGTLVDTDQRPRRSASVGPGRETLTDFIRSLKKASRRSRAWDELDRSERSAVRGWRLNPAASGLFAFLRSKRLLAAVLSRHGHQAVDRFLKRVRPALGQAVGPLILREELASAGRGRDPFRTAARAMQVPVENTLVVSSEPTLLDRAAAAGAITVLLTDPSSRSGISPDVHFQITDISRLTTVLRLGTALPSGKLPNDLLREFLAEFEFEDPSLLIHPGVGEDIAAVDVAREEVLVLKSDPITFATDAIGQYAVLVNANDIATAGATPRWLLTTLLFPPGSTPSAIGCVVRELRELTSRLGITLCGGHTEISDAVRRPVISGMMAGTVRRRDLIDKRRMRSGDRILLTKALAVEGTAIIAREFGRKLQALGMTAGEVQSCREFLDRISILPEAAVAAAVEGTSAMHDVTEGGIATALEELSAAGGFALKVKVDRIPIFPETRTLSRLLRFDPFGLIGSGSLLVCCRPKTAGRLAAQLRVKGIGVTMIGEVAERGSGVQAFKNERPTRWRSFEVDEIARLFSG
jgi:hydrogenase maturation factor/beta-phosphoglucomutase-like phosphatase (HAD superfamily)